MVVVYVILALGVLQLVRLVRRQTHTAQLVRELEAGKTSTTDQLLAAGLPAFPHLGLALNYDDDPALRRKAGEVIVRALLAQVEELGVAATVEDAGVAKEKAALLKEAAKTTIAVLGCEPVEARKLEGQVASLLAEVDLAVPETLEWQKRMRRALGSDKVSRALRDEDAEVRRRAAAVMTIIGCENFHESERIEKREQLEKQIVALAKNDDPDLAKSIVAMEDFAVPFLTGVLTSQSAPKEHRQRAGQALVEVLAEKFRDNERSEVAVTIGERRMKLLLHLCATAEPEITKALVEAFSMSPKVKPSDIEKMAAEIRECSSEARPGVVGRSLRAIRELEG